VCVWTVEDHFPQGLGVNLLDLFKIFGAVLVGDDVDLVPGLLHDGLD
jgi:hypothetical protein